MCRAVPIIAVALPTAMRAETPAPGGSGSAGMSELRPLLIVSSSSATMSAALLNRSDGLFARAFPRTASRSGVRASQQESLDVVRELTYYDKVSNDMAAIVRGLGGIITVIFGLGAMLGAVITMHGAVSQRRREIAVLRALGFTPSAVLVTFVIESALLALAGAVLGVALALVTPLFDFSAENFETVGTVARLVEAKLAAKAVPAA